MNTSSVLGVEVEIFSGEISDVVIREMSIQMVDMRWSFRIKIFN